MLSAINLVRLSVRCCGRCQSLVKRISTSAVFNENEAALAREKLKFLESERQKYENTFGDIESFERKFERIQDDPEDIAEYERQKAAKGKSIAEYKAEISDLLTKHNYKEAIRVLEVDMANDKKLYDMSVIGIFRMLFNYTALKGDLEEAYRLYIRYRSRQGRMTGPMYTALFNACANCKNSSLALKRASLLRENIANDKFHKTNIFNYNAMLKAFGRHGDIATCLNIFDEVLEKRLKAFTYTYNFLLQSCISDRNAGLRHALVIWKKMIQNRRKPDIWFFNLFLRCVRDCSLGDVSLIPDLIEQLNKESGKFFKRKLVVRKVDDKVNKKIVYVPVDATAFLESVEGKTINSDDEREMFGSGLPLKLKATSASEGTLDKAHELQSKIAAGNNNANELDLSENEEPEEEVSSASDENIPVSKSDTELKERNKEGDHVLPNLLAAYPSTGSVVEFGAMTEPHDRIMLFGGVTGFLETMAKFNVEPNVRTLSLLLCVTPDTEEAEQKIIKLAEKYKIQLDAPFFSELLQKRIYSNRSALVKDTLKEMRKAGVQPDLVCFGVLSFACTTREMGMELLETVKAYGYRANTEILYGLLHVAGRVKDFVYVKAILDRAKADGVELSPKFIAKLGEIVRSERRERFKSSKETAEE